jgi:hypothetical protein
MGWKPDEVTAFPDGSREEIRYRRRLGAGAERSRMRKLIDRTGLTQRI